MKKVIVDFVAHRSVVVALNDDQEEDEAIDIAQNYVDNTHCYTTWEFDNNVEPADEDSEPVNRLEEDI